MTSPLPGVGQAFTPSRENGSVSSENLSTGGFWCLGCNGQDFLTFDLETPTWAMAVPSAQWTKKFWEMPNSRTLLCEISPAQL